MRLEKLKIRGLGPFKNEVSLDLTTVDHKILAVTGANGRGKSTLLELALGGALYRECPTRGSLASLANRRDAFVEAQVVNGQRFTVRQLIDGVSGKGETVLLDEAGNAINQSGKLREADAWIARKILPPEVVYSSIFAHQGSAGFLDLKPAERKKVLLRVLGIERLEAMAEKARERVRSAKAELTVIEARLSDEKARGGSVADAEVRLRRDIDGEIETARTLREARERLAEAQAKAATIEAARKAWRALCDRESELAARSDSLRVRIRDLTARIDNNRGVLARADEIREAQDRAAELDAIIRDADALNAQLQQNVDTAAALLRDASDAASKARVAMADTLRSRDRARHRADELRPKVDAARAALPQVEAELAAATAEHDKAQVELERLRGATIAGAEERIGSLRAGLREVTRSDSMDRARHEAREALDTDDARVARAESLPASIKAAAELAHMTGMHRNTAERKLSQVRLDLASATELDRVEAEAAHWEVKRDELSKAVEAANLTWEARRDDLRDWKDRQPLDSSDAKKNRSALEPVLKLAGPLAQAEARLAELEPQVTQARVDLERIEADLDAVRRELAETEVVEAGIDVAAFEHEARRVEQAATFASNARALSERALEDAKAREGRLAALDTERAACESMLADWTRLAADLGKDGVQALEVDAAGPELSTLVNELLHTCHGPRFTVSIETTKLSSDGKRQLEGCEVWVLDTVGGREGPVETFSGGERVLVGEAVSLALSVMACRRAGLERPTLVRDETGAALDPANGRAYVAMLRLAAEMVDADKVLFVSHSPELQELADARIVVAEGGLSVE